ncbi:lysophospholipid acyltransferase family protein [Corallincola luteus]|uniref:L-ornithine N(alpha)-acyltransferase n=1 Tax=Corallincola luteus TaxID=1775177 RepID=A0ABY2AK49_9GAMM|nr:lysophospholipid acyltransferase family protein [Corallincola luteus]TCI02145.1 lysophospholipid acyltransferase family protein [Corallincola luteus]
MLSVEKLINEHYPKLQDKPWLHKPVKAMLRTLLNEQEFIRFSDDYPHLRGLALIEQIFEHFNFTYTVKENERIRIPSSGRVVIIANHPIGSLDGLALLHLVSTIRQDVKAVANELLYSLEPLRDLLLPVNAMGGGSKQAQLRSISEYLDNEGAIIIFPAGEVSRLRPQGVRDTRWQGGFLRIASQTQSPVVPVFIKGRNSALFYGTSMLYKPLSTLLLAKEMFRQSSGSLSIVIGDPIPFDAYKGDQLARRAKVKLFKRHLYRIGKNQSPLFRTETAIGHPENRSYLQQALKACELLGATPDGKQILLYKAGVNSTIMRELGRLREIAFRAVGEGTGRKRDLDKYDNYYEHLLLWDPNDLEIAGAYRLAPTAKIVAEQGIKGLYTSSLFSFDKEMSPYLAKGLELGRSFVQPRYWGRRSLDYLWHGIGAYISRYPECRYLFGPVSISKEMPTAARDLMIQFYLQYFGSASQIARSHHPYRVAENSQLGVTFSGENYIEEFALLKNMLANMECSVPTLYKQYSEVCEPGGVRFLDFGIDPEFAACIDGLVLVDTHLLKEKRRQRYMPDAALAEPATPNSPKTALPMQ